MLMVMLIVVVVIVIVSGIGGIVTKLGMACR